ncbi:hypothetical protein [Meiothermus sp. QL-1]|uniref:hypothetical protein n=1 Tax=Meiothermus sp. QL-1 TaxID=2058095 RepID=UPI0013140D18|nr:hypothetical protein [Meiothermus sp. QL-1]
MRPLAEAIYELEVGQMLAARLPLLSGLLKLWVWRHGEGFDLYAVSIPEGEGSPRRVVGRGLVSATEVLEALHHLAEIYAVQVPELLHLPTAVQTATPELLQRIERRFLPVAQLPGHVEELQGVRQAWAAGNDGEEDVGTLVIVEP